MKLKSYFIIINRYNIMKKFEVLMVQVKNSNELISILRNLLDRVSIDSFINILKDSSEYHKVGLSIHDYKKLSFKLSVRKLNIIFLSSIDINLDENILILKKIIDHPNSSFNFYGFSQNSVLEIWLKTKQNADIVFIDDAYDDMQDRSFIKVKKMYPELFKNTKIILLSTGQTKVEDKELLKSSDTFMKKPLIIDKVSKYLLSV